MDKQASRKIVKRANDAFNTSERSNFTDLWENASTMCRPNTDNVRNDKMAGERKGTTRLIDVGIQSLDTFTSGVTSTLVPKGTRFFEFNVSKTSKNYKSDEFRRWLADASRVTLDYIQESNFFSEISKSFSDLGLIGTSLFMTEPDNEEGVRFKTYYINRFAFLEDSNGRVDTIFFKLELTNRQIAQKFGDANVRSNAKEEELKVIIHSIYPRANYKEGSLNPKYMKYASVYILEDTGDVLLESGFDSMPASVCRWSQASNEIYGRSPALQCSGNLNMVNVMEHTKLKSAQRIANPQWLSPDDGSVKNLNNNAGGIVYWNASNPSAEPRQISPRDMPNITDGYQEKKISEIEEAFFVSIWNPLRDVSGNTTASEINNRVTIAKSNLVPKIARVIDELLEPTFRRVFQILLDTDRFPTIPESFRGEKIKVTFTSSAGLIIQQLENVGTLQTVEIVGMLAQLDPQAIDYLKVDEIVKQTAQSNAVPNDMIRSDYEVGVIRQARAEQQEAQAAQEQEVAMASAYSQTTKAPESGSPADMLMKQG